MIGWNEGCQDKVTNTGPVPPRPTQHAYPFDAIETPLAGSHAQDGRWLHTKRYHL